MYDWDTFLAIHGGVLLRSELPGLSEALSRAVRRGRLAAVLPGTCVDARVASDQLVRIAAVARRYPDAVLCDETAARLTFWPQIPAGKVQVAGVQVRTEVGGYQFHRRAVAEEWVSTRSRIRMTAPAMTAMDLAAATEGESIDRVLRSRTATLSDLRAALCATPGRIGNVRRRQVLLDSRDEPWSTAERLAHRILRCAGIAGGGRTCGSGVEAGPTTSTSPSPGLE